MLKRKGQSTLEYAIIIAVVIGGLVVMQHYIKRGYEGRLKTSTDDMGEQFDPNFYSSTYHTDQSSTVHQQLQNKQSTTTHTADQINQKTGLEDVTNWDKTTNVYNE